MQGREGAKVTTAPSQLYAVWHIRSLKNETVPQERSQGCAPRARALERQSSSRCVIWGTSKALCITRGRGVKAVP